MEQLTEMVKPFPKRFMGKDERGNEAVDHTVVTQRLLQIVGPYELEVKEVLRSQTPDKTVNKGKPNERTEPGGLFVTGAVVRLTVTLDGRRVSVEEVGGCENAAMKDGDGERMKHAMSDAIKRCAMRLGLGLHMWAQENFFLYEALTREEGGQQTEVTTDPDGSGRTSEIATQDSPEESVEEPTGTRGSGPDVSDTGSSGDALKTLVEARAAGRVKQADIIRVATITAAKMSATPSGGVTTKTLGELPEDVLEAIVAALNLRQEALA